MTTHVNNQVRLFREQRGWTQATLAEQAGISRTSVSAIEQGRMTPSVDAAIRIARVLGRPVEELFPTSDAERYEQRWAWMPERSPVRYWQARIGESVVNLPVEATAQGLLPHDGVLANASFDVPVALAPEATHTLVMACCDPAVSLLLTAFASSGRFRPICLHRTSGQALALLREGVVHVAGIHLASTSTVNGNARAVRASLGTGYTLVRVAQWESGVAVAKAGRWTQRTLAQARMRWVGRPDGSGARRCQDVVLRDRPPPRRTAGSHRAVIEVLQGGFADAGVSLRLVTEAAGLTFVPVRHEQFDFCIRTDSLADPRVRGLIEVLRSRRYRQALDGLPGYRLAPNPGALETIE